MKNIFGERPAAGEIFWGYFRVLLAINRCERARRRRKIFWGILGGYPTFFEKKRDIPGLGYPRFLKAVLNPVIMGRKTLTNQLIPFGVWVLIMGRKP